MGRQRLDSPYPEMAFNELKGLAEQGGRDLAVARELTAGEDMDAGLKELKRIVRVYRGLWPAKEAGRSLRELEGDPLFRQALLAQSLEEDLERARVLEQEAEALVRSPPDAPAKIKDVQAERPPGEAGESEADGPASVVAGTPTEMTEQERRAARLEKLLDAYALYERIARQGPETEPGREAAVAMKRLGAEEAFAARLRQVQAERQARQWLNLAINYLRGGRTDLAREYFQKVVASYPDSAQAEEAQAFLEDLED
jgi:tetratricopeptide (TPR) repeat protein